MPYEVDINDVKSMYPEYSIVEALTPSAHKAAFHVYDNHGVEYCLKLISPEFSFDRLQREILAMKSIRHPHVARLIEYVQTATSNGAKHHILEEFVTGSDLEGHLGPGEPWAIERACLFFSRLFDGLEALREKNIVHRDIKPSNIRVKDELIPVIVDFGVARHLDMPDLTMTEQGAQIGTYTYFSPEQWNGTKHDIDHRTDLFAVGILLYQALTGHHPFLLPGYGKLELKTAVCVAEDHLSDRDFLNLPRNMRILLSRLLSKERIGRPHSAAQVANLLRRMEE